MPAALDVDWPAVQILAMSIGLSEAAKRTGISYDAIRQRSSREGWLSSIPRDQPLPPTVLQPVTLVTSPAQAMANAYQDQRIRTRIAHSKVALAVAEDLAVKAEANPASMLSDGGQALVAAAKHASLTHGWQEQSTQRVTLCIQALDQSDPEVQPESN